MEAILQYIDNFTPEVLIIETALLFIIAAIFVITWIFNRKKYHNYEHQIPAGVLKSYLDSIIQNSVSLKSSLFRGGGLDSIDPAQLAQVYPVDKMKGGESVSVAASSTVDNEALNKLKRELELKSREAKDLQGQVEDEQAENVTLNARIKELEEALKNAGTGSATPAASSGDDEALKKELEKVSKDRDELKNRLKEYEIIEDDLANLKRLQQENDQLKKALGAGGAAPQAAAPAAAPKPATTPAAIAAEEGAPANSEENKSPEDLLSEFEKMLG
ncbi:MAG: hypothetical protein ACOYL6_01585 [Bacteriovoracaceae bacterium]